MRPFNQTELEEMAVFMPKLDSMDDGQRRMANHYRVLIGTLSDYRRMASDPAYECWGNQHHIRTRALQAVRTLRAYRFLAAQRGWEL